MTSPIDKLIALAEELDAKATKGPVEKRLRDDGLWLVKYPKQPRGFHGDCYGHLTYADPNDVDFFIASRTAWPATARALKTARDALVFLRKGIEVAQSGPLRGNWNDVHLRKLHKALAELDRIAKEGLG